MRITPYQCHKRYLVPAAAEGTLLLAGSIGDFAGSFRPGADGSFWATFPLGTGDFFGSTESRNTGATTGWSSGMGS